MAVVAGEAARLELDVDVGSLRLQEAVLRLPRELLDRSIAFRRW
jgi:hypothetical protein